MKDDGLSAEVMAALPDAGYGRSVTQLARIVDWDRGYVYRRLEALREAGAVERFYAAGKYNYRRAIPGAVCHHHPSRPASGFTEDGVPLCEACGVSVGTLVEGGER